MTDLSPQAQAVLDAVCANTEPDCDTQHIIAAALKAAADQVVPKEQVPSMMRLPELERLCQQLMSDGRQQTRAELLAIAAELRGQEGSNG
jgi:hypothetical protein